MAQEYKDYIDEHKLNLYSSKAVTLPKAELYMVYSGKKQDVPEVLRLSDLCGGAGSIEVTVKVLRGGDSSIVGQYVEFCKIADEQRALYGLTRKTIQETIRICLERGILAPFLTARQKEVVDIMEMLFSQEQVWELDRQEIAREAWQGGRQEGRREGEVKGLFRAIKSLIETTGMSVDQAMTALQVAEKDRPQYLDMLGIIGQ